MGLSGLLGADGPKGEKRESASDHLQESLGLDGVKGENKRASGERGSPGLPQVGPLGLIGLPGTKGEKVIPVPAYPSTLWPHVCHATQPLRLIPCALMSPCIPQVQELWLCDIILQGPHACYQSED
ncbi:collagen alpha-1(XXIII) chain-like isoform X6 [Nannospalax galili]|uniref:collagen alpha-1(XXIII) chain-like isoform X6 n=1 Tax=Nannospalax galili TaxID=1026970 RepID=UPI00111C8DBF|nr:collagen alpha-1(XXIII) chain-like isoform X6 [Nannospalax galili]